MIISPPAGRGYSRMFSEVGVMEQESMGEHILVCLSSAPSNAKIIRIAAQMVTVFHSRFTALFVETPDFAAASEENKRRLLGSVHIR